MTDTTAGLPPAPQAKKERSAYAPLINMRLALAAITQAQDVRDGSSRMCMLYGKSGYGKTKAAGYVTSRLDAAYVECPSLVNNLAFLEMLAVEVGILRPARTAYRIYEQIINQLAIEPRPIIIDEVDHLVDKGIVNIIRDIHDKSTVPILMIGEETLPAKLKKWERFDNRILVATEAQPTRAEDARTLRDHYCTRVTIADDLLDTITSLCKGVTRRITTNLEVAQNIALEEGQVAIDLHWWGDRPMRTGDLPSLRGKVAA